jgi:hypothetical protein
LDGHTQPVASEFHPLQVSQESTHESEAIGHIERTLHGFHKLVDPNTRRHIDFYLFLWLQSNVLSSYNKQKPNRHILAVFGAI